MIRRTTAFFYGIACYAAFFATFLYAPGFVGGFWVPHSIDSAPTEPAARALLIDALLLALFAVQHSAMARPGFKRAIRPVVGSAVERSTYVLASSIALLLLFWQWRPIGGIVWSVERPLGRGALYAIFVAGWLLLLWSTFLIDHFDLFGLRQVWLHLRGRPHSPPAFRAPAAYRVVRHPIYVGWILAFWATPVMSVAHLFFAVATTAYILVAIRLEERDLLATFGDTYARYRERVPMLLPRFPRGRAEVSGEPMPLARARE